MPAPRPPVFPQSRPARPAGRSQPDPRRARPPAPRLSADPGARSLPAAARWYQWDPRPRTRRGPCRDRSPGRASVVLGLAAERALDRLARGRERVVEPLGIPAARLGDVVAA